MDGVKTNIVEVVKMSKVLTNLLENMYLLYSLLPKLSLS